MLGIERGTTPLSPPFDATQKGEDLPRELVVDLPVLNSQIGKKCWKVPVIHTQ